MNLLNQLITSMHKMEKSQHHTLYAWLLRRILVLDHFFILYRFHYFEETYKNLLAVVMYNIYEHSWMLCFFAFINGKYGKI